MQTEKREYQVFVGFLFTTVILNKSVRGVGFAAIQFQSDETLYIYIYIYFKTLGLLKKERDSC